MIKLSEVTPEQAASLTRSCNDAQSVYENGKLSHWFAVLWDNKQGDYISEKDNIITHTGSRVYPPRV